MSPAGWSLLGGDQTVRGVNLTIKTTHTNGYKDLFDEWDWVGWIKFQIDLAHGIGANAVRLIGDVQGVNDGTFTLSTYRSRWRQLIDYAASLGMHTYVAGGGQTQLSGLTTTQVREVLVGLGEEINGDPWVLAFDVMQEHPAWPDIAGGMAAVRAVCDRPLTVSWFALSQAEMDNPTRRKLVEPHVDFLDVHLYYQPASSAALHGMLPTTAKPYLIGEYGWPNTAGNAAQTAHYEMIADIVAEPAVNGRQCAGAIAWSAVDGAVAGDYGIHEDDGTPRAHLVTAFGLLP